MTSRLLKCMIQWFLVIVTKLYDHHYYLITEHFHHPKRNPCAILAVTPHSPSLPRMKLTRFNLNMNFWVFCLLKAHIWRFAHSRVPVEDK